MIFDGGQPCTCLLDAKKSLAERGEVSGQNVLAQDAAIQRHLVMRTRGCGGRGRERGSATEEKAPQKRGEDSASRKCPVRASGLYIGSCEMTATQCSAIVKHLEQSDWKIE
jgi:hypothetical protein